MQGFTGLALFGGLYRPCTIPTHRAVLALHYTQGFTRSALYAVLHGPYSTHMGRAALIISAGLCRPCIIYRAVQALDYTEDCIGPPLYIGLYRPCTIHRFV